jgi:hypothetical protein
VLEDLSVSPEAVEVEYSLQDNDNPDTQKQYLGTVAAGETLEVAYAPPVAKNVSIYTRSILRNGSLAQTIFDEAAKQDIDIPPADPGAVAAEHIVWLSKYGHTLTGLNNAIADVGSDIVRFSHYRNADDGIDR